MQALYLPQIQMLLRGGGRGELSIMAKKSESILRLYTTQKSGSVIHASSQFSGNGCPDWAKICIYGRLSLHS